MGKRSAGQLALDKIDAEIADLQRVRGLLIEAMDLKPTRKATPRKSPRIPMGTTSDSVGH